MLLAAAGEEEQIRAHLPSLISLPLMEALGVHILPVEEVLPQVVRVLMGDLALHEIMEQETVAQAEEAVRAVPQARVMVAQAERPAAGEGAEVDV